MITILGKGFISWIKSSNYRNLQLLSFQKIYTLLGVLWNARPWKSDNARLSFGVYWYLNEGKTDATLGFKDIMACRINESFQVDRDCNLISTESSLLKMVWKHYQEERYFRRCLGTGFLDNTEHFQWDFLTVLYLSPHRYWKKYTSCWKWTEIL